MKIRKLTKKENLLLESLTSNNDEPIPNNWLLKDDQARARRLAKKGLLEIRHLPSRLRPNTGELAYFTPTKR